ncbi:hypothetical protein [Halanaerobium sp. ST460_2HS_T2]|uniref:hypothetical protein n=1 Tax=Halanaerobium sp. ST460_2HS_T2 TaxID=2183914 RepID=UPI000DF23729|nr:hypothetical protein [Halanaerobium sp. ST460_2HS_T2]RCW49795.1 hypothetical protein DFR80_1561 [Halanaerobium sp. ST460_2HS_T2]
MKRAITFIDLLAFSNYVRDNPQEAINLFDNYNNILKVKITDEKINPISSYTNSLREIAETKSINSFEYFIPFSDSIFISSQKPNKFVKQLSSFLIDCFKFTSDEYINPENKNKPTEVRVKIPRLDENKKLNFEEELQNWFPVLFRGGISFGEAYPTKLISIFDSEPQIINNLVGKPVVKAVKLEQEVKGPLIVCDCNFYDELNKNIKYFFKKIKNKNLYKLLWPAFNYIKANNEDEIRKFDELFYPAVSLWKANNHKSYSMHYFNFLKLVVESSLRFFDNIGELSFAKNYISKQIKYKDLDNKIEELYGSYSV